MKAHSYNNKTSGYTLAKDRDIYNYISLICRESGRKKEAFFTIDSEK